MKLLKHKELVAMFEMMIIVANNRLNDEKVDEFIDDILDEMAEMEEDIDLSDHSSDED
jgi:hypothetical protein